jgi:excisionase family DNA binding protein
VRNLVELDRSSTSDTRDTVELFLNAMADAIADRLERRQEARRRLLDIERTAEYLGMSEDSVYRLVSERKLKPVRFDRRPRFDIRDLDKLIEEAKGSTPMP